MYQFYADCILYLLFRNKQTILIAVPRQVFCPRIQTILVTKHHKCSKLGLACAFYLRKTSTVSKGKFV